jgi:hypothetical protein
MGNRRLSAVPVLAMVATALTVPSGPGAAAAPAEPPADANFQKVTLDDLPGEPIAPAVLPDRRVLHTARTGEVRINDPKSGRNILAAKVPVRPGPGRAGPGRRLTYRTAEVTAVTRGGDLGRSARIAASVASR